MPALRSGIRLLAAGRGSPRGRAVRGPDRSPPARGTGAPARRGWLDTSAARH